MKNYIIISVVIVLAAVVGIIFMLNSANNQPTPNAPTNNDTTKNNEETKTMNIESKLAILVTSMGKITIEFYTKDAPRTVENFIGLASKDYYNGVIFHRVVKDFVAQGGDPTGTGRGGDSYFGGAFEDELNPSTESYKAGYKKGVVAMANRGPNTNTSQFFIMLKDAPLDSLYTIFGKVIEGQDVVDSIGLVEVDPQTDKPLTPIVIESVTIIDKK